MVVWQALFWEARRLRDDKHCSGRNNDGSMTSTALGETTMAVWQALLKGGTTMAAWQALLWRGQRWRCKHFLRGARMVVRQALFLEARRLRDGKHCSGENDGWRYDKHCSGGNNDGGVASTAQGEDDDGGVASTALAWTRMALWQALF